MWSYKIILEPKYETFLGLWRMGGKLEVMPRKAVWANLIRKWAELWPIYAIYSWFLKTLKHCTIRTRWERWMSYMASPFTTKIQQNAPWVSDTFSNSLHHSEQLLLKNLPHSSQKFTNLAVNFELLDFKMFLFFL